MNQQVNQTIADLITTHGLRAVLAGVQSHCANVVEDDGEIHDADEFGDYEDVGDRIQEIIEDLD